MLPPPLPGTGMTEEYVGQVGLEALPRAPGLTRKENRNTRMGGAFHETGMVLAPDAKHRRYTQIISSRSQR